jgi:hypothetical protein
MYRFKDILWLFDSYKHAKQHLDKYGFDHIAHVKIPKAQERNDAGVKFAELREALNWFENHPANQGENMLGLFWAMHEQDYHWCAFESIPEKYILDSDQKKDPRGSE